MFNFTLDILNEFIYDIISGRSADNKNTSIRTLISLYDSIKHIEVTSEKLLLVFEKYIKSPQNNFDVSMLRVAIRNFSSVTCDFSERFRRFERSLPLSATELTKTFRNIGHKTVTCRSLIEITTPDICFDSSLPLAQKKYLFRALDYAKYNFSTHKVQQQWSELLTQARAEKKPLWKLDDEASKEVNQQKWTSESRTYSRYEGTQRDNTMRYVVPLVKINENVVRTVFGFKILSFTDIEKLNQEIQTGREGLESLRIRIKELEYFLSENYSISDFF